LLELAEAAFDEMALSVKVRIKRMFDGARGIVRHDCLRALPCDDSSESI
jgi:hypothetical protein